jgi:RHS repeat-associated protein
LAGVINLLEGMGLDDLYFWSNNEGTPASFPRDPMNSTIGLVNSSGTIIDQTRYDPYGNTRAAPRRKPRFEFTGRENDTTPASSGYYYSNLYFMRGRYYAPQLARFISRDPVGLGAGTNMYEYAGDNPVDFSDPRGACGDNTGRAPSNAGQGPAVPHSIGSYVDQGLSTGRRFETCTAHQ